MKVKFHVCCIATYSGELKLPENFSTKKDEILSYILDHLDGVPVNDLEYISDTDEPVTEEDIYYIGE